MAVAPALEQEEQIVAFRLAGETYGIPISLVHEIIRSCEVTAVPCTAEHVRGVINLRGKVVPVIDLRRRLGLPSAEETRTTRIIVVELPEGVLGMIVDAVSAVLRLPESQIEPPSELVAELDTDLIRGVGKNADELIVLLDIQKILSAHP
ncbi:MAG TPA: chemotaxis protein CheW [Chthonomonadales bacterium]|nr:chemotaxis protein CheW [Chthonomonadales bacterium]